MEIRRRLGKRLRKVFLNFFRFWDTVLNAIGIIGRIIARSKPEGLAAEMENRNRKHLRIIVKVGTSTLTRGGKRLCMPQLVELVRQLAALQDAGCEVVLVTSGGISAGREVMELTNVHGFLPEKQMLAAIGQPRLMAIYTQLFGLYGKQIAQVLLTRDDLADRPRYMNARNTLEALLSFHVIPIINENDTVAIEEIQLGDNDNLSALVANVLEADLLILLTDQDGVLTADPRVDNSAELVRYVDAIELPPSMVAAAGGTTNGLGTGGMLTKIQAADLARHSGSDVVIANGNVEDILIRIVLKKEQHGTLFCALGTHLENRKRFLLSGMKATAGSIQIDDGAVKALKKGGSLLPVGVRSVKGKFERGESVTITNLKEKEIAVGLSNYDSRDILTIAGQHSENIESLLGYVNGSTIVHRNNLVLLVKEG
jgi:glutamate 5-kinase